MRILVSGASGLVGKNFIRRALKEGHEVHALVRDPSTFKMLAPGQVFRWDHREMPPAAAFERVDAVLNLSGENIAGRRWTTKQRAQIVESRLLGTKNLIEALGKLAPSARPKVFLSGSAIGYYGYTPTGVCDETAKPGGDFLAKLCVDWEAEALRAEALGLRVVLVRTGIVLSREGGALAQMPPVQIGSGKNWMSWIHIEDMVDGLLFALERQDLKGPVNFVAPNAARNRDFARELAHVFQLPGYGYVPALSLKVGLGEAANVILSNLRVVPAVLQRAGFEFRFDELGGAIKKEFAGNHILDRYFFRDQFVPMAPEEIFPFFSRAENLEELTPPWLNFKITAKSTPDIEVGSLIDYRLKIHGMPVRWRTRITEWKENEYFVDDQLKGPYSKWHHLHTFEKVPGGCLLRDEITYRVPASFLGKVFLGRWIANDVNQIFSYRQNRIQEFIARGALGAKSAEAR